MKRNPMLIIGCSLVFVSTLRAMRRVSALARFAPGELLGML